MTEQETKAIESLERISKCLGIIGETEDYTEIAIKAIETVARHRETFEWCHDCKEYDSEKNCCPRWTKQIRDTVAELNEKYRWHDLRKNPDDLPDAAGHVVRLFLQNDYNGYIQTKYTDGFIGYGDMEWYTLDNSCMRKARVPQDNRIAECYKVIAWREIEPFEEE